MILIIKLILTSFLVITVVQDIKYRAVYWFVFPIIIGLMGYLHFSRVPNEMNFYLNCMANVSILCIMMTLSLVYFKIKYKQIQIFNLIGIGDILFFLGLALGFPVVSFAIILTTCLILSLVIHLIIKSHQSETVPLAGYAALTLLFFYGADWLGLTNNLYIL